MRLNWKSSWILGVVVLMLLASYVLQRLDGDGDSPPDVPDSELTPAATPSLAVIPPRLDPTQRAAIDTALQTVVADPTRLAPYPLPTSSVTPSARTERSLAADERRGGHTIVRHVGKSDEELRQRLDDEPDISAASTYPDLATAQRVVQSVLSENERKIEDWAKGPSSRANLVLRMDLNEPTGRSMEQGASKAEDCEHAVVVLRADGRGWYVLTSYPEKR